MKKTIALVFLTIKLKAKYVFFASFLLALFLFSCVKEDDFEFNKLAGNQYNPSIAAPFVNSRLTLKDILKDTSGIIQIGSDNSLRLIYNTDNMVSITAKDLFKIPDQNLFSDTNSMLFPPIPSGDSVYYSFTKPFPFTMPKSGQRLDSVFIKTGTLKFNISTNINHSGKMLLSTPNITYPNGQIFSLLVDSTYTGGTITQVNKEIDISGCKINFNNTIGHPNELVLKYEHTMYGDANPNLSPYYMHLSDSLLDLSYDKLIGYIGPYDYTIQDTILIPQDHIKDLLEYIDFYKVGLSASINNSYGLPIDVKVDTILAKSSNGNVVVTNFPIQNPISINYPSISQIGQSISTTIPYQENTSLADAINKSPTEIIFKVTGKMNPNDDPAISNFVIDTSTFTVGVHVELPLEGKIAGFVLQDTLDFDLGDKIKNVDEVTFKINTINAFPLDANVQVYFANTFSQIIDSMITTGENVINSGIVNATTHLVTAPTSKSTDVVMGIARLRKMELMNIKKFIIKGKLTSFNNGNQVVKLTNNDYLDVKLGMKIKINANSK